MENPPEKQFGQYEREASGLSIDSDEIWPEKFVRRFRAARIGTLKRYCHGFG
jgi:hypothetical protein